MRLSRILIALVAAASLVLPAGASSADPVADPTGLLASPNVKVHTVLPEQTAVGARFRGNLMYLTSLAGGLSIYDVSNPAAPVEVGSLALPHFENEDVDLGGNILLISNDAAESYGILYVIDISDPKAPELLAAHDMQSTIVEGQLGDGAGHTASCILECTFAWVTQGGRVRLIDLRNPAAPVNLGPWNTPIGGLAVHDVQMDENGLAWISGFGGAAAYRIPPDYAEAVTAAAAAGTLTEYHTSLLVARTNATGDSTYDNLPEDPTKWPGDFAGAGDGKKYNDFILHNSRRLQGSDVVYITEEDYNRPGCRGAGSFETWRLPLDPVTKQPTGEELTPIDKWETELLADTAQPAAMCSAHYFDVLGNVVAQAWYEQGLRLLDVSDPANIRQIGYFIPPNGESWAAYFPPTDPKGRILYLLDASLGLVVLEFDRPTEGPLVYPPPDPGTDPEGCTNKKGKPKKCKILAGSSDASSAQSSSHASSESQAPTVTAPVLTSWVSGTPRGAPSSTFGFACRIAL